MVVLGKGRGVGESIGCKGDVGGSTVSVEISPGWVSGSPVVEREGERGTETDEGGVGRVERVS